MSAVDIEQLLRAVSPESPCGDDLEYDAAYLQMTRAAAGKPQREMGGQVLPGEEPDWRAVREQCVALLGRSKDLRLAVPLAQALLRTDGLGGFAEGLAVIHGLLERYWGEVHPRLDPDDKDPTFRMNTLAGLASREHTVGALRLLPLAASRRLGRFGLRDFEIANGTLPKPEGAAVAEMSTIEAAFLDMDAEALDACAAATKAALERLDQIDQALITAVGAESGADFSLLNATLKSINGLLQTQRGRRGLGGGEAAPASAENAPVSSSEGRPAMSGPIQSREDVIRSLDQVCDWYAKHEPSSPVPLLLKRAKRLVNMSFLEAVQDLTPGGLNEIQTIAGVEPPS